MASESIPVGQLKLDLDNPRYGKSSSQREAIEKIIDHQGAKLVKLAEHIAANGMNPADSLIVMQHANGYTVLEGNRRLAAVRLLTNPSLASGTLYHAAFKALANLGVAPVELDCAVVEDRDAAKPWILLRHAGESEGRGIVRWGPAERERFSPTPGTQAAYGLAFIEAVRAAYPGDDALQDALTHLGDTRITTLGRLVGFPGFRKLLGMEEQDGDLVFHYPAKALADLIKKIIHDVATDYSSRTLNTAGQREDYVQALPDPPAGSYTPKPVPLGAAAPGGPKPKTKPKPAPPARPKPIFDALSLDNLGDRTPKVLAELKKLDPTRYPNAAAFLIRVVLELAVDAMYTREFGKVGNTEFKSRIRKCVNKLDASQTAPEFMPVRQGLSDGTSLMAVSTLHAFVHCGLYHPDAGTVRSIASNYEAFLKAINDHCA